MQQQSNIAKLSWAALVGVGLIAGLPAIALGGGFRIDINLGAPPPPPVVVIDFNTYCVGFRANLYDADWRLRNAQIEQWNAADALDAARRHEGEIAIAVEEREALVADFGKRVAESDAALAAARAAAGRASEDIVIFRARAAAFERRAHDAREDVEASAILRDADGGADAQKRVALNEAGAAVALADARAAEHRADDLRAAEAAALAINDLRIRYNEAQDRLPRFREELTLAHEQVFAAQQRFDASIVAVAQALHDRDEALWMLHRDEIFGGRASLEASGFRVDLGVWGGRRPDDIEVMHAYFVHPVGYWVEHPAEIQVRLVEAERVTEISRVREIQRKHEGPRFAEVARVEATVPHERRAAYFERVTVERERLSAEKTERTTAAAEHRAPRIPESVRADARASRIEAHGEARAEEIKARGDANAKVTEARGEARAEETHARAEDKQAQADARAKEKAARDSSRTSHDKNTTSNAKDPHKKQKDEQASVNPNSR